MSDKPEGYKFGRPTKYRPEYCQMLIDYFSVDLVEVNRGKKEASELPMLIGFAQKIGVHFDTLNEWCQKHDDFSVAYSQAKKLQEQLIVGNSINNRYNAYFAQFMLKNNHGWKDKTEVEQHTKTESVEEFLKREKEESEQ